MSDDQPGEVEEYIARHGWEIQRRERDEIILRVCPLCKREPKSRTDRNFYINADTSVWHTYCCNQKGNLIVLKKMLGELDMSKPSWSGYGTSEAQRFTAKLKAARGSTWDKAKLPPIGQADRFHKRLMSGEVPKALEYLHEVRKFNDATIGIFKIGVAKRGHCKTCNGVATLEPDGTCPQCKGPIERPYEMISIPFFVGGQLVNFKFRSIGEKRFERVADAPTTLFNTDCLGGEFRRVVICEAELDAMSMYQLGYHTVVAVAGATKNFDDDWVEALALFDEVLLAYDSDPAGEEGAGKAAAQLGRYRCRRVQFPLKDANECLQAGLPEEEIRACVEAAASYQVNQVKPFSEFADEVRAMKHSGPKLYGKQTRWREVNRILGGFRDGELTVVTGDTASGKTTWTTCLAWDMARGDIANGRDPSGVLIASFEVPIKDVARKLVCMELGKGFRDMSDPELDQGLATMGSMKLFFLDQYGDIPLNDLRDAIEYGVRRYGLWMVVLDHLHFFIQCKPEEERFAIDHTLRQLKLWALKLGIHLVLVVHPSKLRVIDGREAKVELNDLKGSSEIKKTADSVIRIWRPRDVDRSADFPPYAEFTTLKCRSDFGTEASVPLSFDTSSLRYEHSMSIDAPPVGDEPPRRKRKRAQGTMDL
jgi:twinkle protein